MLRISANTKVGDMYLVELHLRGIMDDLGKKLVSGLIKCQATFEGMIPAVQISDTTV